MKMQFKRIMIIMLAVLVILGQVPVPTQGASELLVDITKNDPKVELSDVGERTFEVGYDFDVNYDHKINGHDLVLVLDRSNSMLKYDPATVVETDDGTITGLPIADAVKNTIDEFVIKYFIDYPESNVAIVSFGTNGNKSDNWKYYNNLEDVLEEVAETYEYRDIWADYHSNFRAYFNNGYRYAWENWQITDGATNIKEAFEYATRTVEKKQLVVAPNDENIVILFSDGVATFGGAKSQKNLNDPTAHNTNTIAGYEAGILTQEVAKVITVGYFQGIENELTEEVARETLELSQEVGFFEAASTQELTGIFGTIVEELNYIGTDAVVREIIEDEFDVLADKIEPEPMSVTEDDEGNTIITWSLGNVIDAQYKFGYKVKAKNHVYPSGSGNIKIPINRNAALIYTDLDGNEVIEHLGINETTIPPLAYQPPVKMKVNYNKYKFLVGDQILMDHEVSFTNEAPYDYKKLSMDDLTKTIELSTFGDALELVDLPVDQGWKPVYSAASESIALNGTTAPVSDGLIYDENYTTEGDETAVWTTEAPPVPLTLRALKAGHYNPVFNVDYQLTNSIDLVYDRTEADYDHAGGFYVKEGILFLKMVDDENTSVTNVDMYVDGALFNEELIDGGGGSTDVMVKGITSGTHEFRFMIPSGYLFISGDEGITSVDEDEDGYADHLVFSDTFSYDVPEVTKNLVFKRLDVKDVAVTDINGASIAAIDELDEDTMGIVEFTLTRPLIKLGLNLIDDFRTDNHSFVLDNTYYGVYVRNSLGESIDGFSMNGSELVYSGEVLPVDTYQAFGIISPPSLGMITTESAEIDFDYDYDVYVNMLTSREEGEGEDTVEPMTSRELHIGLDDEEPPVIVPVIDPDATTTNEVGFVVGITDKIVITDVEVYKGEWAFDESTGDLKLLSFSEETELTLEEMTIDTPGIKLYDIDDNNEVPSDDIEIDFKFELDVEVVNATVLASGSLSIYAVDFFGNASIYPIVIENEEYDEFIKKYLK